MARKKIKVTQIRDGKRVTFLTPDKGKPGKTPKEEQWYQPGVETGWEKDMPQNERRDKVLGTHKGDELASARSMQALANVTTDRETAREARADALYFYGLHREIRRISRRQRASADAQYFFRRHRIGKRGTPLIPREVAEVTTEERLIEIPKTKRVSVTGLKSIESGEVNLEESKEFITGENAGWVAADRLSGEFPVSEEDFATGEFIGKAHFKPYASDIPKYIINGTEEQSRSYGMGFDVGVRDALNAGLEAKPLVVKVSPKSELQKRHARRSSQAQARDEQQSHQVTIEVDSPRVKVWLKDPSAADIKGIDTPRARRSKSPRITPKTPKLRR